MVDANMVLSTVRKVSGITELQLDSKFPELGLDSTNVLEMLIEFEILLDIDLLAEDMNLDEILSPLDILEYIRRYTK